METAATVPVPTSGPRPTTLYCRDCRTPLATVDRRGEVVALVPNSRNTSTETRVPCPACGEVRVVTHR